MWPKRIGSALLVAAARALAWAVHLDFEPFDVADE